MRTALDIALTVAPLLPGWLLTTLTALALALIALAYLYGYCLCLAAADADAHVREGD